MGSCSSSSKRKSNRNDEIYNAISSSEEFQDTLKYNTRGNQDTPALSAISLILIFSAIVF